MGIIFGKSKKVAPGGEGLFSDYNADFSNISKNDDHSNQSSPSVSKKGDGKRKSPKKKKKRSSSPRQRKNKN